MQSPRLVLALFALVAACGGNSPAGDAGSDVPSPDASDGGTALEAGPDAVSPDAGRDAGGGDARSSDAGADAQPFDAGTSCNGIDCDGHGRCTTPHGAPVCACDTGFAQVGTRCLAVNTPTAALEFIGWEPDRAYPGVEYRTRLAVRGGEYPYGYSLLGGPPGMTVDPATGKIRWTAPAQPAAAQAVRVSVTDRRGDTLEHDFSVTVTTQGFFFVAMDGADDASADGSFAHPWRTLAYANDPARNHATSDMVYVRAGTYDAHTISLYGSSGSPSALIWMAWPNEHVVIDAGGMVGFGINTPPDARVLFQGFELQNAAEKMFWVDGMSRNLVFRDDVMHGITSVGRENPSFIFFTDDAATVPPEGTMHYDNVVVQDSVFYNLRNDSDHGAATVMYDVERMLFEDNTVYDIDGRCVGDKDDGYRNTFRHNICHDTHDSAGGLGNGFELQNQGTQAEAEVSYNLIWGVANAVAIGWQPGYIHDVWVHHNTVIDAPIEFRWVLGEVNSGNANVYSNVIVRTDNGPAYTGDEPEADTAVFDPTRVRVDGNLVWLAGGSAYVGNYGQHSLDLAAWRAAGMDALGTNADPMLDANHALPAGSPYRGVYGWEY